MLTMHSSTRTDDDIIRQFRESKSRHPNRPTPKEDWPEPLVPSAFHGLAGEIVKALEPHTEADGSAILLQLLVAFGAIVGHGPHVRVEGDEHHANLFGLLVGATAKARKGTSWGRVKEICSRVESCPNIRTGLSSGEGLIFHVRDAVTKPD